MKWWLGFASFFVLFFLVGSFAYLKMSFLIKGVQIEAKVERQDSSSSLANIKGNAKNAIYISINGREIFIDKDGSFSEPVVLIPGLSVITIDTKDKFGKNKEKEFQLVYNRESAPSVALVEKDINTN